MNIFFTGGTGFVGKYLAKRLLQNGHDITVLTRKPEEMQNGNEGVIFIEGDPTVKGDWQKHALEHDVIINLAGASIYQRWTRNSKNAIRDSRIQTTRNVVEALSGNAGNGTLLINASAVGYYGPHGDEDLDESGPPGDDFLASLATAWEDEAVKAEKFGVRVLCCRFGVILGNTGGALKQMLPFFKWWLGSPFGTGNQWFSWIHLEDLARICLYLMEQTHLSGAINCTAPNPVRNTELTAVLGKVLNKPTFMPPVPGVILRLMMGEFGSVLLNGQKVIPKRLLASGFVFNFPGLKEALTDLF